jgi:hypothetical protein
MSPACAIHETLRQLVVSFSKLLFDLGDTAPALMYGTRRGGHHRKLEQEGGIILGIGFGGFGFVVEAQTPWGDAMDLDSGRDR